MEVSIGGPLDARDAFLLARILNGAWAPFVTVTPEDVRARFASGQLFVVARDRATPEEQEYIRATYPDLAPGERVPIALLETMDAVTGGDPARVPATYAALTAEGRWRPPLADADTLVLVDLTTATSRQRSGVAREVLRAALAQRGPRHRHVFTFTPDVEAIRGWHEKRGARASGVRLAAARPGHVTPDVHLMDYSAVDPAQLG